MTTCVCFGAFSRALFARSNCPDIPRCTTTASGPSSRSTRYLPRRCTAGTLRPSSCVVNSFLLRWRRIDRSPVTSTVLIFLPTTSLSRSRRITSTSGSSGIIVSLCARLVLQTRPGHPRRRLFGLLLRSTLAVAVRPVAHVHGRIELLRVIRPFVPHEVAGPAERSRRGRFLQPGLVVAAAGPGRGVGNASLQAPEHEIAGRREARIEIDGRDDGLEGVSEDRLLRSPPRRVLSFAEEEVATEAELGCDLGQDTGVHDAGAHFRELPFGQVREVLEHVVRDDETEHRVA